MTFQHDAEFVHGEIVERSLPDEMHSAIQFLILLRFGSLIQSRPLYPRPEIRMKVAPDRRRGCLRWTAPEDGSREPTFAYRRDRF